MISKNATLMVGNLSTAGCTIAIADRRHLWRRSLEVALANGWPEASVMILDPYAARTMSDEIAPSAVVLLGCVGFAKNVELQTDLDLIHTALSDTPVLLLTEELGSADVTIAMSMGAKGYLTSNVSIDLLVQTLRLLMIGGVAFPAISDHEDSTPTAASPACAKGRNDQGPSIDLFTPRELQVLAALGEGKPNKIIAYEFNICETTVKVHVSHIMRKLGAKNRTHAALLANDIGDELGQAVQILASDQPD